MGSEKSLQSVHVHLVWTVHGRAPALSPAVRAWLLPSMAVNGRAVGCRAIVVGGHDDHVHVLATLPMTVAVAELVRRLKGASVRLLHLRGLTDFRWQEGYAALSVGPERLAQVHAYVLDQDRHHGMGGHHIDTELLEFSPEGAS